uniref:FHA domain-containing protein n=1 Tax=Syphacia muris TaxID=451379 RepID=A0A0N5AGV6_9BILA
VFWIGEPSSSPLAVIHGPTGTFVVTKSNIIIGRDTTDSDIDLTSQEANFHSSSYMVLSYTGHPNRWGVQLNGNIGVIINKKLYQPTTVPQYFPFR